MKKGSFIAILIGMSLLLSFVKLSQKEVVVKSAYKNSHIYNKRVSGSPGGKTGAPGEGKCTDCHSGSATQNSSKNQLVLMEEGTSVPVTTYKAGVVYDVFLTVNDPAVRKGFQSTARVLSNNTTAGNLVNVSGSTAIISFAGKQFVNHVQSSTTSTSPFAFKWTAPSSNVGDIKFYVASNISNNNQSDSGDQIHLSQHTFSYESTPPTCNFSVSNTTFCTNTSIFFASQTTGSPTSFNWVFTGGTPSVSSDVNPQVSYNQPGTYDVSLTVTNADGTATETKSSFLTISDCSSVGEQAALEVYLFPNPAAKEITIAFADKDVFQSYEFLDLNGKSVLKGNLAKNENLINVSALKKGSYILMLYGSVNIARKKVVIE